MEHITNHPWFWPVVIFGGLICLLLLFIRDAVVSYKESGPVPKEKQWQVRVYAFVGIVGLSAVGGLLLQDFPLYVPMIVGAWVGLNAAFVPQEVSWKTAFLYTFQLIGTGIITIMIIFTLLN